MSAKARWGLVSTANVNRHMLTSQQTSTKGVITAVASRDAAKAKAYAEENAIPRSFGSYDSMFQDPDVDCVYVSLPNHLHKDATMAALAAGKHVLCEKPIADSAKDAKAMFACAREHNVVLAEAWMDLHSAVACTARRVVAEGQLGDLLTMRGHWTMSPPNAGPSSSSGGSVWGLGGYPLQFARFVTGLEPVEAVCKSHSWDPSKPAGNGNDFFSVSIVTFSNGCVLTMDCGTKGPPSARFEIVGTNGSLTIANPFRPVPEKDVLVLHKKGEDGQWTTTNIAVSDKETHGAEYIYQIEFDEMSDVARAPLDGRKPMHLSEAFSVGGVLAQEMLEQSMRKGGSPVTPSDIPV